MKKNLTWIIIGVVALAAVIILSGCFYTVAENEYAAVLRFSKIESVQDQPGLHFKLPFVDSVMTFPRTTLLYDIPESEVLTADKKNMTVDSYLIWQIRDPQVFYQTLGSLNEAENRLDALTYTALKNLMGTLEQNDIINQDDASERNDIYASITTEVSALAKTYGIDVLDVKVKRLDLPADNEQAVYNRMISDRNQIAEKYTADGNKEASILRNEVDKQVNILISNAQAQAAKLEAEGESAYMQMLAEAYATEDQQDFYEFIMALDALKASLTGTEKTVILNADSELGRLLVSP